MPSPRSWAASLLVASLAPQRCGGWQAHSFAVQPRHATRTAEPRSALSAGSAEAAESQAAQKQQRQTQVREALNSLLPSFAREADDATTTAESGEGQSTGPLAGTLPAMLIARDSEALKKREALLEESYEKCRQITAEYAKTFYFGTSFFSEEKRKAVWAVYAWCRRTDDIVDKPRKDMGGSLRSELKDWRFRLGEVFAGRAYDDIDLALVDTVQRYPDLSIQPFEDMIKGMVMDLDQNRFETFSELYLYCYRVAGTVGLMTMPIMGTAEDATYEQALEPALALGVALQLTNILRDVGEDRVRQRIYIPQEDLRAFNVSEASLLKGIKDEKYEAMLKFQIECAREWYRLAEDGIPMLAPDARLPVRASLDMYSSILNKIEANNYDNFNKRAYTAKWEKLMMLPKSYLTVKGLGK